MAPRLMVLGEEALSELVDRSLSHYQAELNGSRLRVEESRLVLV
jgi:hypothetical protein